MRTREQIEAEMEEIHASCSRVYGTTKDGSMGACLGYRGYGKLQRELERLNEEENNESN